MSLKERATRLKTDIPAVFLAMKRKETPLAAKLIAGLAIAYALSPIDFIPDFIPVIGYLDDLLLLPILIAIVVRLIPPDIFRQCREEAVHLWREEKPKKWYYAIPIILIWLILGAWIVREIWF